MRIKPLQTEDIADFLMLAAAEKWLSEPWELEFLLLEFSKGCFAARTDEGKTAGFVTSLRHDRSGWIGNLIVDPQFRGKGIGEALFKKALEALYSADVETIWLTASKTGMPLYQKLGFNRIDTIIRWSGTGRQRLAVPEANEACDNVAVDSEAWGDSRAALLAITTARGKVIQQESAFAVLQPCGEAMQLGPFSASGYSAADALLKAALHEVPPGIGFYLDAPASNRTALQLFNRVRMQITGRNELMYSGVKPAYRPELIYALATMGSCG